MSALIEFDAVCKYYQMGDTTVKAADHITMKIEKGEFVAIVGESGSGKSTCMNIIGCLDVPTYGTYRLNGRDVGKMNRNELAAIRNEMLGFIFQQYNLLPKLNLLENVEVPLVYAGIPRAERHRRAREVLEQVGLVLNMICSADVNDQFLAAKEQAMRLLGAHRDNILLDEVLFDKIKAVYDRRGSLGLDAVQTRLVEKIYGKFVRAGALLDPQQKERLRQINGELALLPVKFGNNVLRATNDFVLKLTDKQLDGLPASVQGIAREKAAELGLNDAWVVTLDAPSRIPFLTYSTQRDLREQLYKAYIDRCNEGSEYDNRSLVNDFARLRNEKARLLGYPSYAAYVTADEMAGTPAAVYELLNEVWTPALDRAKEEMAEMNTMLQRDVPGATFEPWDWWYYAEKVRKDKYALDDATLRPYFSLENVREGAFSLANRLYGITFRPLVAPVYHKDCSVYEVLDVDGTHLGVLYFDFFPRSGKSSGAWCTAFRSQRYEGDERIAPVVAIVCNFTPPTKLTPSLLTLDEVQTLFHEFGHGLHALFADVKYRSLGRVEGDFVELPSQIMENWATEPEVLRHYAINYTTGEVIPERLIKRIRESGKFNQGFIVTELVAAALTDMDIHAITEYEPFDVNEFEADAVYGRRGLIPQIQPRYRYPYFLHIFDGGYASGYYFYIWAQVLDKDAFRAFEQTGDVFDRATARKFRTLLSRGGSADGMTLYRDFRGADPDKRAMLVACGLMEELPEEPADSLAVPVVTLEPNEKPKI